MSEWAGRRQTFRRPRSRWGGRVQRAVGRCVLLMKAMKSTSQSHTMFRRNLLCGILLAVTVVVLSACPSRPRDNAGSAGVTPGADTTSDVLAQHLIDASDGWAVTPRRLALTTDGGASWKDITPPGTAITPLGIDASSVRGAFFLDPQLGWAAVSGPTAPDAATPVMIVQTTDGGGTWRSGSFPSPGPEVADAYAPYGPVWLDFVDRQHGWVVVKLPTSANFSRGDLLRTADGGATWTKLSIPIGDPVSFHNENDGWTAGGPGGDQLFVTHDGGGTWERRSFSPPSADTSSQTFYGLPVFENSNDCLLPVTFVGGSGSTAATYATRDGGRTWNPLWTSPVDTTHTNRPSPAIVLTGTGRALFAIPGISLFKTGDGGRTWAAATRFFPPDAIEISFASDSVAWARIFVATCTGSKTDLNFACSQRNDLLQTTDGGLTWTRLRP